jgi:hypothetical protein
MGSLMGSRDGGSGQDQEDEDCVDLFVTAAVEGVEAIEPRVVRGEGGEVDGGGGATVETSAVGSPASESPAAAEGSQTVRPPPRVQPSPGYDSIDWII